MGVLFYFRKEDGSGHVFALNKVYHYGDLGALKTAFDAPVRLADVEPTPEAFAERFYDTGADGFAERAARRLYAWAADAPVRFTDEHDDAVHAPMDADPDAWDREHITGSSHGRDYEADGVTYKPGSGF